MLGVIMNDWDVIHIDILDIVNEEIEDEAKILHRFPSTNRWPNRKSEWDIESISS
jgi:hypothetical protein